jgi:hypothetical protein
MLENTGKIHIVDSSLASNDLQLNKAIGPLTKTTTTIQWTKPQDEAMKRENVKWHAFLREYDPKCGGTKAGGDAKLKQQRDLIVDQLIQTDPAFVEMTEASQDTTLEFKKVSSTLNCATLACVVLTATICSETAEMVS